MNYGRIALAGLVGTVVFSSIGFLLAAIYAKGYEGGSGLAEGARFGLLVGVFVVCAVVADEYVTLNIGRRLALAMAAGRLIEWTLVGMAIGWVYRPVASAAVAH